LLTGKRIDASQDAFGGTPDAHRRDQVPLAMIDSPGTAL
jgi:hypothetical protein